MTITVSPSATRPVLDRVGPVSDQSGLTSSPGLVRTEDRTAVLPGPVRTAVSVPVLVYVVGPVRSSVLSPSKNSLRTGTGPDPATLASPDEAVSNSVCVAVGVGVGRGSLPLYMW